MEMAKETIEKIVDLSEPFVHADNDDNQYLITKTGEIKQIRPELDYAAEITLHSLDALIQMVKSEAITMHRAPVYIEAQKHDKVSAFLQVDPNMRSMRVALYNAVASDIPGWKEETELPYEQALIAIRTRFQQTPDTAYLLKLLSEISCGAKVTFAENGIATTVITRQGVALQGSETIKPIVTLRPYRTFQELEQPTSEFHIRISERGIKFIEADGGMWKIAARRAIVKHLTEHLSSCIEDERVFVML